MFSHMVWGEKLYDSHCVLREIVGYLYKIPGALGERQKTHLMVPIRFYIISHTLFQTKKQTNTLHDTRERFWYLKKY